MFLVPRLHVPPGTGRTDDWFFREARRRRSEEEEVEKMVAKNPSSPKEEPSWELLSFFRSVLLCSF